MREEQQEPGRTVARESDIAWFFKLLVLALLAIAAVLAAFNHDRLQVYESYIRSSPAGNTHALRTAVGHHGRSGRAQAFFQCQPELRPAEPRWQQPG